MPKPDQQAIIEIYQEAASRPRARLLAEISTRIAYHRQQANRWQWIEKIFTLDFVLLSLSTFALAMDLRRTAAILGWAFLLIFLINHAWLQAWRRAASHQTILRKLVELQQEITSTTLIVGQNQLSTWSIQLKILVMDGNDI